MSDLMVDFYNSIAEEVAKKHPDKFCAGLAYMNYIDPPKQTRVSPHFLPVLAPLSLAEEGRQFDQIVRGWQALSARVYLYSYDLGLPTCPQRVAQRFANYKRWGLNGVLVERRPCWAISGLNYWLEQRLMWNWDTDADANVDEFCRGLFGPRAGPVMKRFFMQVEEGAPWSERSALVTQAASLLDGQPDSPEAQCLRVFDLGETLLATQAQMQEAERNNDWQAAAEFAARGIAAFRELEQRFDIYYRDSGDAHGSYHRQAVEMEPVYRNRVRSDHAPEAGER